MCFVTLFVFNFNALIFINIPVPSAYPYPISSDMFWVQRITYMMFKKDMKCDWV